MKKNKTKEYVLVDGKLQENSSNPNIENSNLNDENIENKDCIVNTTEPILKIKDFNLHYNLTKNPFLHKNSDHDNINSIEEYYILKGRKYYNFGSLIRTKLLNSWTTKRLIKKAFKSWQLEASEEIDQLLIVGDAQAENDNNDIQKKLNFILSILPFISLIILTLILASTINLFAKPTGTFKLISYISLALSIFLLSINSLFNRSIIKYNRISKKGKQQYLNIKNEFVSKCETKFNNTYTYYCKKINRKFDKKPLSIDEVSYDENALKTLQDTITKNSQTIVESKKISKLNNIKRKLLSFLNIINIIIPLAILIYSIAMHFINK